MPAVIGETTSSYQALFPWSGNPDRLSQREMPHDAVRMTIRRPLERFVRFAPWLILGPISGPLAAGFYRNWRAREFVLASLYLLALGVWLFDLSLWAGRLVHAA
jgi:hypothetical protein